MKKRIIIFLMVTLMILSISGCNGTMNTDINDVSNEETETSTRMIIDMSGRKVEVPKVIKKAQPAFLIAEAAIYTLNPEKILAKSSDINENEKKYVNEKYYNAPVLGSFMRGNEANEEELLKLNPDVMVYMGILGDDKVKLADETQKRLGIPIVLVDSRLDSLAESYIFLGDLLNEENKAKELSEYTKNTIEQARKTGKEIKDEDKVKIYCAQGEDGLTTDASGSIHAEIIDLVGGKNAADVEGKKTYARSEVSMEEILKWNPEVIVVHKQGDNGLNSTLNNDKKWEDIDAIKNGKVYEIPVLPFNWYDRPPSVNRIMGIKWLGNLLYPEEFDYDMKEETKGFYELFYNYELTDEEFDEITENALR